MMDTEGTKQPIACEVEQVPKAASQAGADTVFLFNNWTPRERRAFDELVHQLLQDMRSGTRCTMKIPQGT